MAKRHIFLFFLLAVACYFPLFLHLDSLSLELWDEARRANNALEMLQNGNWLVTHYDGQPEMWGTKPPFLIWCQVIAMKALGVNELAVRIPSALAALATVSMLIFFSYRVLKKPLIGVFAGLVLLTSEGYIATHVSRSGDFDTLLALWENSYLLLFFCFTLIAASKRKTKFFYLTALFVLLAGFTKGIAGFLFLPGIFLFTIWQKEVVGILKSKHTWIAATTILTAILGFYFLRDLYNPGYIQQVLHNEVGGRYLETRGGHIQPWYYYPDLWFHRETRFAPWIFLVPIGVFLGWNANPRLRKLTQLLVLNSIVFLTIISISQTKIIWYQAPVYPALALLVGIGLDAIFQKINTWQNGVSKTKSTAFLLLFVLAIFGFPYYKIVNHVYEPQHNEWEQQKTFFRDFMKRNQHIKNYFIVHNTYNSHVAFYQKQYNRKGYQINHHPLDDFKRNKYQFGEGKLQFQAGDTLMMCEWEVKQKFKKKYKFQTLNKWESCEMNVVK